MDISWIHNICAVHSISIKSDPISDGLIRSVYSPTACIQMFLKRAYSLGPMDGCKETLTKAPKVIKVLRQRAQIIFLGDKPHGKLNLNITRPKLGVRRRLGNIDAIINEKLSKHSFFLCSDNRNKFSEGKNSEKLHNSSCRLLCFI